MPNSPPPETTTNRRLCDFCNQSTAILYCRADTAKLCLSCDREVHSTNPLFTKHTRSLLCDACDSSPASIFCSTHAAVHCQNCDWETHNNNININDNVSKSGSPVHDRRPLEGFTGCPSVTDLLGVFGFEDLSKKGLFFGGEDGSGSVGSGYGFEDCFVWETPGFVSLDDLIVSSGFDHNYQAIGVPPLPKNRNAAFGAYKDELLSQLRELAKSDPSGQETIKPMSEIEFPSEQSFQLQVMSSGLEHKFDENVISSLETNTFQWCPDGSDAVDLEFYSDQLVGRNADGSCIVPDEKTTNFNNSSNINVNHEDQPHHNAVESIQVFHGVGVRDINSQERETALTRYKEKKKSRRYDKHIRYESRKVRAESRIRIRGRFAKMDR